MASEIVSIFAKVPEGYFVDATFGLGGHTLAIEESLPGKFRFLGFDRDGEMLSLAKGAIPEGIQTFKMSFSKIPSLLEDNNLAPVTGALFDLGLNSMQIDDSERGFSYREDSPLDLRYDRESGVPLYKIVGRLRSPELIDILKNYGQEKNSRAIAKAIIEKGPATTGELTDIIRRIVGPRRFVKAASRVFQALRIFVNDELDEFEKALKGIIPRLTSGGRVAVISYHSLEDGITKRVFRILSGRCICGPNVAVCVCGAQKLLEIKTKKPMRPDENEIRQNPRSRSARLRYAEKL